MQVLLGLALVGCGGPGSADVAAVPDVVPLTIDAQAAFDPIRGPIAWTVSGAAGASVTVSVMDGETELWSTRNSLDSSGQLDGTWMPESPPDAGPLVMRVSGQGQANTDPFVVVRPGFIEARLSDADRIPLYWRGGRVLQDTSLPISVATSFDHFPELFEGLINAPAEGTAEPVAYPADARPVLTLSVPSTSELGGTGLEDAVVEVLLDGWSAVGSPVLAPGGTVDLQRDAPLGGAVGIDDVELELRFQAIDGPTRWDLGQQTLPLRFYRMLGAATTGVSGDEANPWVVAIDPALRAIEGTPAEHGPVVDALVDWIYNDLGLVYDTVAGASFYSSYIFDVWDEPHFYLSDFLIRRNGSVINCSDSSNILSTHANMLGAELVHIVILENYQLNEIKAIGQSDYTSCPFGPWGCGFSYHAVATDSMTGARVWDTTLALDGDLDPGSAPSTELLVQSIDGDEYISRLVRSGSASYAYPARITYE